MTPKAEIKNEKKQAVDKIADSLKESKSVVFVDYTGMDVQTQEDFRNKLRESGGVVKIAKNTLIKLAGQKAQLPKEALEDTVLSGQTAMIMATGDAVLPIQVLGKFVKETEKPEIKAGVVEGLFQDKDGIIKITKLPSKEELAAQVVGGVAAPMYGLLGTLNANMQKLVYVLDQARQQKSQ